MSDHNKLRSHAALDEQSRFQKAQRIKSALGIEKEKNLRILDIGTGAGYISRELSWNHKLTSIDVVDERVVKDGFEFRMVDSAELPFTDNSFDIVVSNQVVEHVPEQDIHISEIQRVLRKGGMFYIATPNGAWIVDPHTKLLFVNWLPRSIANVYSKFMKKGAWDVFPLTYVQLKRKIGSHKNLNIVKDSFQLLDTIDEDNSVSPIYKNIKKSIPKSLLSKLIYLYPSTIFIVNKK